MCDVYDFKKGVKKVVTRLWEKKDKGERLTEREERLAAHGELIALGMSQDDIEQMIGGYK